MARRPPSSANPMRPPTRDSPSRHGSSSPATTGRSAAGSASSSWSIRCKSARNSKRRNISCSSERSGGASTSSPGSQSMSRSRRIVASTFDSRAWPGVLAKRPRARGRQLVDVLEHAFHRVELLDQLRRGLVADAGHARDRVGGVALEADQVGNLLRRHAQTRRHAVGRVHVNVGHAARRHHQADVLGDQLERVAVGGDDARRQPASSARVARVAITSSASQPSNSRLR